MSTASARPPDDDRTLTYPASPGSATVTAPHQPPPVRGFDEEVRRLLRRRLILVHLLTTAQLVFLQVMSLLAPENPNHPAERFSVATVIVLAGCVIGAGVLWRTPAVTLRTLRVWEVIHFGLWAAACGVFRFSALASVAGDTPNQEIGFWGAVSLFSVMAVMLAYGVLIPNTPRRSLWGVLGLTAVPFVALAVAAAVNPVLWAGGHVLPLAFQAAFALLFPAAIAVFAAARADALQRRAFEAERRAEQVGQYTLRKKLGEGGMGEVWLAEHRLLKRPCAVKFVRPELAANPATAARFAREVQAVTALTHPNTVRVYDYGRADDGAFFCVMEYLDGPTLDALVREVGPLPPGRAVYLLRQVCGALAEAHAAGLVHRDIKPGNVIVAAQGGQWDVAKLLDFGLVHDLTADTDDRLTNAGTVLGTPAFMCPEQAAGESTTDPRGDVYSLGAVAFFALTGRPPFQVKPLTKLLAAHRFDTPPLLVAVRPDCPPDLAAVVARCLAKEPAERFPSAAELERALAACGCAADWSPDRATDWWRAKANS